jgi:hypothetical protein
VHRKARAVFSVCLAAAFLLAACTKDARETTDSVAGAVAAPAMISLAEVAGTWNIRAVADSGSRDTTTTTYVLEAKPDTGGWTITYPDRAPIPVRVWAQGDSVITEAGPYPSVRRPGVHETMHSIWRLQGGTLVGSTIARYATAGADSILRMRVAGGRAVKEIVR